MGGQITMKGLLHGHRIGVGVVSGLQRANGTMNDVKIPAWLIASNPERNAHASKYP
jgi:hypothetical protein